MKRLKLRIAKFNKMLVVEQLQRNGDFYETEHIKFNIQPVLSLNPRTMILNSKLENALCGALRFESNEMRDECAANFVKWITEEQFGGNGKLEIGKPCLVRDYEDADWEENIYAGKLSHNIRDRDALFLTESEMSRTHFVSWKYAKPLNSAQPKIDGEIYTWEVEE